MKRLAFLLIISSLLLIAESGGSGAIEGGGDVGDALIPIAPDFSVDKSSLKVVLKQGQTKIETLKIKNTGADILDVKVLLDNIEQFKLYPESNNISAILSPNEEKAIELVFRALENEKPEIYPKTIVLKSPSSEKEVIIVIEVDSAQPLFDVDVEALPHSKSILPGKELLLDVSLFNVKGFGRVDVSVEYAIKDFQGNVVASEHETLAVETQAKFTRSLLAPSDLKPGNYVALAKVTYGDSVGTSSDIFEVTAKTLRLNILQVKDYRVILLIGAALMTICILIFSAYRLIYSKKKSPKGKAEEIKQLREDAKSQKLRKELEAIEKAYKSGLISEESYQKGKKRIEGKLK
ncbi:hypothetical protein HYY71_05015 [Candidatus Woesearchaeota archaeon]|nr:hypothetical protein [Candidatus Woesearchaeota archaeon]